jgi:hypothetical protein
MMTEAVFKRLSDHILDALELSVSQRDVDISDHLARALEMALTRNAGGADFVERREFSDRVAEALSQVEMLKKAR